jgi:hypothetical protein
MKRLDPKYENATILQIDCNCLAIKTAQHPRRLGSSKTDMHRYKTRVRMKERTAVFQSTATVSL